MENSKFNSIKDTEVLSNEVMNEIEGASCDRCSDSCSKSHSNSGDGDHQTKPSVSLSNGSN